MDQDPEALFHKIRPWDIDPEAMDVWNAVKDRTQTGPGRVLALIDAVRYICDNRIAGDIVECGVLRGGSMMAVGRTLMQLGDSDLRSLWLYDTFTGMSEPSDEDIRGSSTLSGVVPRSCG